MSVTSELDQNLADLTFALDQRPLGAAAGQAANRQTMDTRIRIEGLRVPPAAGGCKRSLQR